MEERRATSLIPNGNRDDPSEGCPVGAAIVWVTKTTNHYYYRVNDPEEQKVTFFIHLAGIFVTFRAVPNQNARHSPWLSLGYFTPNILCGLSL